MLRHGALPGQGNHTYEGFSNFSLVTEEAIKKF